MLSIIVLIHHNQVGSELIQKYLGDGPKLVITITVLYCTVSYLNVQYCTVQY